MADISVIQTPDGTSYNIKDATARSGKADKVSNATNGHFAALDSNGNLTDSGYGYSDCVIDYITSSDVDEICV